MKTFRLKAFWFPALVAAAALLSLTPARPVSASPLDPAHVPGEAKWVIHVDLSALAETELAQQVREKRPQMVQRVRQWMQKRYGIDPRDDLQAVTMFSESYQSHTGTMILKANYDRQKVQSELKDQEGVQTESWMDHTLYTVDRAKMKARRHSKHSGDHAASGHAGDDDGDAAGSKSADPDHRRQHQKDRAGRTTTIVLYDDQTVILTSSAEQAKEAVDLLKGDHPSLKGKNSPLLAGLPDGAIVYGAAIDLQNIDQHQGFFPILRQHERIVWTIGQQDEEVYENLTLVARSPEVAEQMKTTLEGLVALSKVWAGDNETLQGLFEETEVELEDRTVQATWRGETGDVVAALRELRDRYQKRAGRDSQSNAQDDGKKKK